MEQKNSSARSRLTHRMKYIDFNLIFNLFYCWRLEKAKLMERLCRCSRISRSHYTQTHLQIDLTPYYWFHILHNAHTYRIGSSMLAQLSKKFMIWHYEYPADDFVCARVVASIQLPQQPSATNSSENVSPNSERSVWTTHHDFHEKDMKNDSHAEIPTFFNGIFSVVRYFWIYISRPPISLNSFGDFSARIHNFGRNKWCTFFVNHSKYFEFIYRQIYRSFKFWAWAVCVCLRANLPREFALWIATKNCASIELNVDPTANL